MNKALLILIGVVTAAAVGLVAYTVLQAPPAPPAPSVPPEPPKPVVAAPAAAGLDFPDEMERSIKLPQLNVALGPGPGRGAVMALCTNCHTPRYILMQPPFSRKVWDAEVHKMKNAFGAPVTDAQIPEIVDYLMTIRGKQ